MSERQKELLVVDDEPMLTRALSALFSEKGFRVTTAATAHDALEKIHRVQADVVLLDLKLPDSSGLDVLSQIKTEFPHLRVVVISALGDPSTIQEAMQRGASGYLAKPFSFDRCFYTAMGVETVDAGVVRPEPEALACMPVTVAQESQVLPIRWVNGALEVAMADPLDVKCLETLKSRLGCELIPVAAIAGDLSSAIRRCYSRGEGAPSTAAAPSEPSPLLHELLQHAHANRATDLHLGIGSQGPWVRERVDGLLCEAPVPAALAARYSELVSHLLSVANLPPAPSRLQQGRATLRVGETPLELRISVLPTAHGEHLAIRLLAATPESHLEQLGLTAEQQGALESLLTKSSGLVLVTGPSGTGKSTTLYACLSKLNTGHTNIVTIEDPVEHELPGLTQISLQPKNGLTFAEAVRSLQQHEPDIVMVGELRDQETAQLAVRTALTGHLVLSTLHTLDASSAITRLLDYGVEPFFLCSTLSGILAQRLLRRLCPACREPSKVEAASLIPLGIDVPKESSAVRLWRARGCANCRNSGYHGRTGIFELLVIDHQIRSFIIKRISGAQIRQSAIARGMMSLSQSTWRKVQAGDTSLEELVRVLPPELR